MAESPAQRRRREQQAMRNVARGPGSAGTSAELERRLTEMLAAGGVSEGRTALELLYMVPDPFRVAYMTLFHRALGMADGGTGARGSAQESTGVLGKAPGKTAGGGGKRYKQHWVVRDDDALKLKERIDKRLRGVAREILEEIFQVDSERSGGSGRPRCPRCGQVVSGGWHYCAMCGVGLNGEVG